MKISIIVPTFNNLNFLNFFLSSLKKNSFYDHQIILHINDGSDGTLNFAKENKLLFTYSKNNIGLCSSLNKAAELAKRFDFDYWDGDRRICYGGYRYLEGRWEKVARAMAEYYHLPDKPKILDIGCGKGFLLYDFLKLIIFD